VLQWLLSP